MPEMTRREFIVQVGKVGGSTYAAMSALGLLSSGAAKAFGLSGDGKGKKVVIVGAGIAGMTAAYELGKVGYECTILEARTRSGGRNFTVRGGTKETEVGFSEQTCAFEKGQYLNAGPARIPGHHLTMDYCRELGVPLEVFGNLNESAYYYNETGPMAGKRVRVREAKADMRGHTAEMLAKAVNQDKLDMALTVEDKEKLLSFLVSEGSLNADRLYKGSGRRGYRELPGSGLRPGVQDDPYNLMAMVQSGFGGYLNSEMGFDQQMMMFQPVGGMDRIPLALEAKLPGKIRFGVDVKEIRQSADGVRVVYTDARGGSGAVQADYGIVTVPLSVLKGIPSDFSPAMLEAIASVPYAQTGKVGLQFKRRFWEEDDRIYGGISKTSMALNQIFYPSSDYLGQKGVLVGYYNFGTAAADLGKLAPAERVKKALELGRKIHPQYDAEFETGYSIAWHQVPHSLGGWANYTSDLRAKMYPTLNKPDGRLYLAGEHLSYLTGWMAGAFGSARDAVTDLHKRVQQVG